MPGDGAGATAAPGPRRSVMIASPAGMPAVVPPAAVPLSFLLAAGVGLTAFGLAAWFAADRAVVGPTHTGVVSAVHVGMLACLTTAVLGALHQFAPVVGRQPLRSVRAAWATLVLWVSAAWLLPTGFAHGPENLVVIGGLCGAAAVSLAIWNLSATLASRDGGVPIAGLRLSVSYLAITVTFGVVYAFDRQAGWFPLYANRVLAHAHLGLLGWLGLTYMSVAEKLWPMFLLAHRPHEGYGAWAVGLVAGGVALLAPGLLFANTPVAAVGAALVCGGIAAHLTSLASAVRHRRRALELLHGFLFASAAFLLSAVAFGAVAGLADLATDTRSRLVAAEVASLMGWLALAIVGHAYKVVPFIAYTNLRGRGIKTNHRGGPLLFGDLFDHRLGITSATLGTAGFAGLVAGLALGAPTVVAAGGVALAVTGAVTTANLAIGPWRAGRLAAEAADPKPKQPTRVSTP